jgi:hypothetical protein
MKIAIIVVVLLSLMYQVESKMMQLIDGQIEQECPDMNKEQR